MFFSSSLSLLIITMTESQRNSIRYNPGKIIITTPPPPPPPSSEIIDCIIWQTLNTLGGIVEIRTRTKVLLKTLAEL